MQLHHIIPEAEGGESTFENCIPLCLKCHSEAGHYNAKHPIGNKYSKEELRIHRDNWYRVFEDYSEFIRPYTDEQDKSTFCEGDTCLLHGFLWREGAPDTEHDPAPPSIQGARWWILNLPRPISVRFLSIEDDSSYVNTNISRVQLLVDHDFYEAHKELLNSRVTISGKLGASATAHHIGDALIEVESIAKIGVEQAGDLKPNPAAS